MSLKHINRKRTPEYISWNTLKQRCYNPKNHNYGGYGGRGITVCERWKDSFEDFLEDMGKRPTSNHSIERIDVNGNYEPSNCKWSSPLEQARNRRTPNTNTSGHVGIGWISSRKKFKSVIKDVSKRVFLGYFDSFEEALRARKEAEVKYWGKSS